MSFVSVSWFSNLFSGDITTNAGINLLLPPLKRGFQVPLIQEQAFQEQALQKLQHLEHQEIVQLDGQKH